MSTAVAMPSGAEVPGNTILYSNANSVAEVSATPPEPLECESSNSFAPARSSGFLQTHLPVHKPVQPFQAYTFEVKTAQGIERIELSQNKEGKLSSSPPFALPPPIDVPLSPSISSMTEESSSVSNEVESIRSTPQFDKHSEVVKSGSHGLGASAGAESTAPSPIIGVHSGDTTEKTSSNGLSTSVSKISSVNTSQSIQSDSTSSSSSESSESSVSEGEDAEPANARGPTPLTNLMLDLPPVAGDSDFEMQFSPLAPELPSPKSSNAVVSAEAGNESISGKPVDLSSLSSSSSLISSSSSSSLSLSSPSSSTHVSDNEADPKKSVIAPMVADSMDSPRSLSKASREVKEEIEMIDPSGRQKNHYATFHGTGIIAPQPLRHQVTMPVPSSSGADRSNLVEQNSMPSLSPRVNRSPMTPNRHLRMSVPSEAALLTQGLGRRKTTRKQNTMSFHAGLSGLDFSSMSTPDILPKIVKPEYGPFVQPPLMPYTPYNVPEGEKFQFLYNHPMDVEPLEEGTFPEQGKYLVDLDMPAVGTRLPTTFIAPKATLLTNRAISCLLPTLTILDLSQNTNITDACFAYLPSSLRYLDLRSITNVSDDKLRNLPRTLQHLNLRSASRLTNSELQRLPKTLTSLTLSGEHPSFTCSAFAKLPRGLKVLRILGLTKITKASAGELPPTLTTLELPRLVVMRDKCVLKLPRSLLQFHMGSVSTVSAAALANLPPKLQHLNVVCTFLNSDSDLLLLPATCQQLHVSCTAFSFSSESHFSNLTVLGLTGLINVQVNLPTTLTALKYSANSGPACAALVKILPSNLKFLNTRGVAWEDESIPHLPQGLVWMSMDANSLTSNCFESMPRQLEYLRLQAMRLFRPEALQYLPPTMKYLHLDPHPHNKMLMKHCPLYLPQWEGTTELARLEDTIFGRDADLVATELLVEDPNLWTPLGQRELDHHEICFDPVTGALVHGVGYLYPFEHMRIPTPPAWNFKFKVKTQKKATPDVFDPTQPTLAPFDIHLVARTAVRRTLIPEPAENAKMFFADVVDTDLQALDPATTDVVAYGAKSITSKGLAELPQSLAFIDMRNMTALTSAKDLFRLFKGRDSLTVVNFEKNPFKGAVGLYWKKLPRTLVALDLSASPLEDDIVEKLPTSMTYLALATPKVNDKTRFPSSLTALYLTKLHRVDANFAEHLPRTLVHLDLFSAMEVDTAAIQALPKHSLRYLNLHSLKLLPESVFMTLPRHLQYLSLASLKGITDKSIEALPRSLTHLDISAAGLSAHGLAALPSRLTHLSVSTDPGHDRIECIAYLPRSLTVLNYGGDLQDSWVDFLPPFLRFLNLPFATSMTSQFVARLPRPLLYFGAHSWARPLLGYKFSCPELLYLDVFNADVTQVPLDAFPTSLQFISSSNAAFKNECAKQLLNYDAAAAQTVLRTLFPDADVELS